MLHSPLLTLGAIALAGLAATSPDALESKPFTGAKANTGTVTYKMADGKPTLTLSDDFKIPDTPAPHWQLVDARGNAFLLARLMVKGGKLNKTIVVPEHVHEIAKVQIWCAFAETLLGETSFAKVVEVSKPVEECEHASSRFMGAKANVGNVRHSKIGGQSLLTLSDDFKVPETPAPHWQVVDSQGKTFLLQRLVVKDGKLNKTIAVPAYVRDVAKVQIWCSFAETLLGEATFESPVM